jgi:hypothetical protein
MLAHIDLCSLDLELGLAGLVASPTELLNSLTSLLRCETSRLQALAGLFAQTLGVLASLNELIESGRLEGEFADRAYKVAFGRARGQSCLVLEL